MMNDGANHEGDPISSRRPFCRRNAHRERSRQLPIQKRPPAQGREAEHWNFASLLRRPAEDVREYLLRRDGRLVAGREIRREVEAGEHDLALPARNDADGCRNAAERNADYAGKSLLAFHRKSEVLRSVVHRELLVLPVHRAVLGKTVEDRMVRDK